MSESGGRSCGKLVATREESSVGELTSENPRRQKCHASQDAEEWREPLGLRVKKPRAHRRYDVGKESLD